MFSTCTQNVTYLWRGLTTRKLRHGVCRLKQMTFTQLLGSVQTEKKLIFILF